MSTHNLCFEQKYEKYQNFYLKIFGFFFGGKIISIFVFVMVRKRSFAQRRLRIKAVCAFAQFVQSLRCPHEETLRP